VCLPRVADAVRKVIASAPPAESAAATVKAAAAASAGGKKKGAFGTGGLVAMEPFRLEEEDFADPRTEREDTLYLPVPSWLTASAARKHVQSLLSAVDGYDMLKPKQYKLIVPESDKNVHRGKCFIKVTVRRPDDDKTRPSGGGGGGGGGGGSGGRGRRPPPSWMTVPASRLPFVRALLHDCMWPAPPDNYSGNEPVSHIGVVCRWAHRFARRKSHHSDSAPGADGDSTTDSLT
jgi:hypothetical protein